VRLPVIFCRSRGDSRWRGREGPTVPVSGRLTDALCGQSERRARLGRRLLRCHGFSSLGSGCGRRIGGVGPAGCSRLQYLAGVFEAFSEQAREAIACAQDEAREMGHETVQVEHLLLGLFAPEDDILSRLWEDFGLTGACQAR
jgi:hypothetical protein